MEVTKLFDVTWAHLTAIESLLTPEVVDCYANNDAALARDDYVMIRVALADGRTARLLHGFPGDAPDCTWMAADANRLLTDDDETAAFVAAYDDVTHDSCDYDHPAFRRS
jgi:hypothetical protein